MGRIVLLFFCAFPFLLVGKEQVGLKKADIQKIMEQIFAQHVDKKEISAEILKNSFSLYIEQFDPEGVYLLQSEVEPYSNISEASAASIEKEYRKGDYTSYEKLNDLIQKAIARARLYRSSLERDKDALIQQALHFSPPSDQEEPFAYPSSEKDLQEKVRQHIVGFLQKELKRFGEQGVTGYKAEALNLYEKHLRAFEDQYTYRLPNGEMRSAAEQENLFTLHVLKVLAKSLDAHTAFFDPNEAYDMRVRLEKGFEGVGIVFQESPQGIFVTHLIEGGPAARGGEVRAGDFLIELDGVKVENLDFEKVMNALRGEKGAPVKFVFKRIAGRDRIAKIIPVTLTRDSIILKEDRVDVTKEQFGNGIIGRIALHSFYQNESGVASEKDVREAIKKLDAEGNLRGLILDLRENSGGFLSQAVKVAGLFITNGIVVVSMYSNGDEKVYRDMDTRVAYNGPLIVLTSKATASAAEIVAQALQDYGVALVVGDEQTYGKGTIQSQTVTDKKGNSYFKVTVGKYYTVSGNTPQLRGVKADVVVPGPYSQVKLGEEYLEHVLTKEDKISSAYNDTLRDIDPGLKPWYLKYYLPSLQSKLWTWRPMLSDLKKNSAYRLQHSKNYQRYLKRVRQMPLEEELEEGSNFGINDLQLAEAFNILKDMIYLHSKEREREYMVGSGTRDERQEAAGY